MTSSQLSPTGRFDRILVGTDGSEFSDGAVRVATAMAVKAGARLLPVSVVVTNNEYDAVASDAVQAEAARVRAVVDAVAERGRAAGLDCEPVVRRALDPFEAIVAAADEFDVDCIVMGRRGRRGLARLMLGDATAKVIERARCSVVVVPKAARMWERRILLATDGSRSSDAAAMSAMRIAKCCQMPVTVVSAQVPGHSAERQGEAEGIVTRVAQALRAEGIAADTVVERGAVADVIVSAAEKAGADLIVMGSHGRTGLGRLLVGTNSHAVIGRVSCPVLVVKGV